MPVLAQPQRPVVVSQADAEGYHQRGLAAMKAQDWQGAISNFTLAIRRNPRFDNSYAFRGIARSNLLDYQGAISDFNDALAISSKNQYAYLGRGSTYAALGNFQAAISDFNQVLAINSKNEYAYVGRGNVRASVVNFLGLVDHKGAISDYNQALAINPRNEGALVSRSGIRAMLGELQGAMVDLNQAIRLTPSSDIVSLANAYAARGNLKSIMGDFQGGLADVNRAIQLNPNQARVKSFAYAVRGSIHYLLGEHQEALTDGRQAIRLDPTLSNGYYSRGLAQFGLRNDAAARADFNEALRIMPTDGFSTYWLGQIKLRQGDYQGAIADYNRAVQLIPVITMAKGFDDYRATARRLMNNPVAAQPPAAPRPQPVSVPVSAAPKPAPPLPVAPPSPSVAVVNPAPSNPGVNVYKIANETTVMIEGQNPGSGVIIGRTGNTYYVLTAKHVVLTADEYNIIAANGKKYKLDYQQVRKFNNLDLAVVQFTSTDTLSIAQFANSEQTNQGDNIFVSGWPAVGGAITRPTHQVTRGTLTGFQRGDSEGYELTYDSTTAPGMSGGPVFDATGRVIGIHGRAAGNQEIGKTGINLGIPIHLFIRQAPQAGLNLQQLGLRAS
jgi:tetratricopeptide (TPR) repeat protein/S1-C subfamily serine protease